MRIENFRLALALKCFKSPYLEKRMAGLNDIKVIREICPYFRSYSQRKQELISAVLRKEEAVSRMKSGMHSNANMLATMWLTPQYELFPLFKEFEY